MKMRGRTEMLQTKSVGKCVIVQDTTGCCWLDRHIYTHTQRRGSGVGHCRILRDTAGQARNSYMSTQPYNGFTSRWLAGTDGFCMIHIGFCGILRAGRSPMGIHTFGVASCWIFGQCLWKVDHALVSRVLFLPSRFSDNSVRCLFDFICFALVWTDH